MIPRAILPPILAQAINSSQETTRRVKRPKSDADHLLEFPNRDNLISELNKHSPDRQRELLIDCVIRLQTKSSVDASEINKSRKQIGELNNEIHLLKWNIPELTVEPVTPHPDDIESFLQNIEKKGLMGALGNQPSHIKQALLIGGITKLRAKHQASLEASTPATVIFDNTEYKKLNDEIKNLKNTIKSQDTLIATLSNNIDILQQPATISQEEIKNFLANINTNNLIPLLAKYPLNKRCALLTEAITKFKTLNRSNAESLKKMMDDNSSQAQIIADQELYINTMSSFVDSANQQGSRLKEMEDALNAQQSTINALHKMIPDLETSFTKRMAQFKQENQTKIVGLTEIINAKQNTIDNLNNVMYSVSILLNKAQTNQQPHTIEPCSDMHTIPSAENPNKRFRSETKSSSDTTNQPIEFICIDTPNAQENSQGKHSQELFETSNLTSSQQDSLENISAQSPLFSHHSLFASNNVKAPSGISNHSPSHSFNNQP